MENPFPRPESLKQTAKHLLKELGKICTLRGFVPEDTFSTHGDHMFEQPLDIVDNWPEPTEAPKGTLTGLPVPDVAGRDIGRKAIPGFDSEGSYREEIV